MKTKQKLRDILKLMLVFLEKNREALEFLLGASDLPLPQFLILAFCLLILPPIIRYYKRSREE